MQMELDDAYSNGAYIPDGASYPARWRAAAAAFRAVAVHLADQPYGRSPREVFDLFLPRAEPLGTVVFVHGGYWLETDKSFWSHLAAGPLKLGWAVAMPSYDQCPTVRIADITRQIADATAVIADRVPGPLRLTGHSAGGHLVARMASDDLHPVWRDRVMRVVPISPLADLAPLMLTSMNQNLRIDAAEAMTESPVKHGCACPVTVWVGGDERPAFLDQARWLGGAWDCDVVVEPDRHHFDVVEGLTRSHSPLCRAVMS
jgi:acetyl esterase/lipase